MSKAPTPGGQQDRQIRRESPVSGSQQTILSRAVIDLSALGRNRIKLTFVVSDFYQLGSAAIVDPLDDVVAESNDPFDEIQAVDPITDQPIAGKVYTQDDLYGMLYSYYKSAAT